MREALSGENNPMYGNIHTPEARERMRLSHIGKTPHNKGVKLTPEEKLTRRNNRIMETCFCCGLTTIKANITRFHNKNCKYIPTIQSLLSVFLLC